jgi:hypothetical protein
MNATVSPFKSKAVYEFWLKGMENPLQGQIINVEFVATDEGYETTLKVDTGNKKFNVKLGDIVTWGEVQKAA